MYVLRVPLPDDRSSSDFHCDKSVKGATIKVAVGRFVDLRDSEPNFALLVDGSVDPCSDIEGAGFV
jgi:hypothetical protein